MTTEEKLLAAKAGKLAGKALTPAIELMDYMRANSEKFDDDDLAVVFEFVTLMRKKSGVSGRWRLTK